jgi:hypothetical protein
MAITYTAARALLASQATTLAAQATIVGLTSLATALTNLSTEITSSSISEDEFFGNGSTSFSGTGGTGGASPTGGSSSGSGTSKGSAAQVYAQILNSAAHTINCANFNIVFDNGSTPLGSILSEIAQASEDTARASEDTARASETIAQASVGIYDRSKGAGIHTKGPQDWIGLISTYKLYIENAGPEKITLAEFEAFYNKIKDLPKDF